MRPYRGARNGHRGWLAVLAAIATLGLLVEGLATLALNAEVTFVGDSQSAVAAPPRYLGYSSAPEATPLVPPSPRPRIHLELPRLGLWPAPAPAATATAPPSLVDGDGRVSAAFIDRYLERKSSPMMGMGQAFWENGRRYDVDPRLLVAISGNETGFGRILTSRFNAFNWFYGGTWDSHFGSWEEAIESVSRGLRQHYLDEGRTNLVALGAKYGPIGAANDPDNLNVNFVPNVTAFLRELGGDPERLTFR